jgi:cation:H+ antiporter
MAAGGVLPACANNPGEAILVYLLAAAGLFLLFIGGEFLVRGSVGVARRLGLSEMLIGLTLVGLGTSVPELVTSLQAVSDGAVGVAVGNVVGSNIANVLLIIGVAALITPIITQPRAIARDFMVMIAATAVFILLAYFDAFTRMTGILLVAALLIYIIGSVIADKRSMAQNGAAAALHADEASALAAPSNLPVSLLIAIAGMAGVVFGAKLLVENAVIIATRAGVSEAVIGLSLVAIGTSLPELATSVVAALRGKQDVAVGNVIGSNIFNLFGILGVTAIVSPFSVNDGDTVPALTGEPEAWSAVLDNTVGASMLSWGDIGMLVLSVVLLVLFALTGKRVARWEGAVLLAAYISYMAYLFGVMG